MRVKIFFSTLLLLLLNVAVLYAQDPGEPCGGQDPDINGCPLDTWVFVLAVIVTAFAARHLHKQKKSSAGI